MNRYDITVRGESVHIEFKRINDSRRIASYRTQKAPNLFGVKAVLQCEVTLPASMAPDWYKKDSNFAGREYIGSGMAFCSNKDQWDGRKGRHIALGEALGYHGCDDELNVEITDAFTAEEARRTKVKGPARKPKTATPKARRPSMRETMARICELLERINAPLIVYEGALSESGEILQGSNAYINKKGK